MKLSELSKVVDDAWAQYGDMPVVLRIKTGNVDGEVFADTASVWEGPAYHRQPPQFYIETVDEVSDRTL